MHIAAPKPLLILDYKLFFGEEPPENRISLISHISKESILYEISALNYRLKPKTQIQIDESFETQVKELNYFTQTKELYAKYSKVADKYTKSKEEYPVIFNRQACLFAMEEIVNSTEIINIDNFNMARIEVWDSILKYLLAVNYAITQIREEDKDTRVDFESLNPKLLPLNEMSIETDPVFTAFRGFHLINFFLKHEVFSNEITQYFKEVYDIEPQQFIFELFSMYLSNSSEKPEHNFFYFIKDGHQSLFDKLSVSIPNNETHKLITIRKSPFINVGHCKYILSDNSFLLEKTYSQFLNDFWFDWIKNLKDEQGKSKFKITFYRSAFGYFFENYMGEILKVCFENYKHSVLLLFDQLKLPTRNGNIEIADVYFRSNSKIILGQVKSSSIYDDDKFGGSIETLYKNDRNSFFEKFGVNQVVKSIEILEEQMLNIDPKFPKGHVYAIFPCIFLNDKALQTPLMADTFNARFQELIADLKTNKVTIKPLTLIHISDLEKLENYLNKNPKEIWELFRFNQRDKHFIPPIYATLNFKLRGLKYPDKIMKLFTSLVHKYNPNKEESRQPDKPDSNLIKQESV